MWEAGVAIHQKVHVGLQAQAEQVQHRKSYSSGKNAQALAPENTIVKSFNWSVRPINFTCEAIHSLPFHSLLSSLHKTTQASVAGHAG